MSWGEATSLDSARLYAPPPPVVKYSCAHFLFTSKSGNLGRVPIIPFEGVFNSMEIGWAGDLQCDLDLRHTRRCKSILQSAYCLLLSNLLTTGCHHGEVGLLSPRRAISSFCHMASSSLPEPASRSRMNALNDAVSRTANCIGSCGLKNRSRAIG